MDKKTTITIRIDKALKKGLMKKANHNERDLSKHVRKVLKEDLKKTK